MDPFLFALIGRNRPSSKKKKTKAKKDNWYERLTVDELKQICRAANLPVTGTKKVIIERLLNNESTNDYAWEGQAIGCNVGQLKSRCQERNLVQSGTKLSLVLRIVQYDHGSAPEATAAATKRPAPQNADGAAAKKKRKPAKPDLEKIHDKVLRKIESCSQKKYQSHYGSKCHSPEVYSCVNDIIQNECFEKKYVESDPLFALDIAKSALVCLADNFDSIQRPGYDEDYIQCFCANLERILIAAKSLMDDEKKNATLRWIEKLESVLAPYGLGENFSKEGEDARYLHSVINVLITENATTFPEKAETAADADEKEASSEATQDAAGEEKVEKAMVLEK